MIEKSISISIIQCKDKYDNLMQIKDRMAEILNRENSDVDLILMPEFQLAPASKTEEIERVLLASFKGYAERLGCWIVCGSIPCISDEGLTQRTYVINDAGIVAGHYDEIHLGPINVREDKYVHGNKPFFFNFGDSKISVATANDLYFPEFIRSMALAQVSVVCSPVFCPLEMAEIFSSMLVTRAFENDILIVRSGNLEGISAVSPNGTVLAKTTADFEEQIKLKIDMTKLKKASCSRYFRYVRKDLYFY
jgi:predicted amidohydrolase